MNWKHILALLTTSLMFLSFGCGESDGEKVLVTADLDPEVSQSVLALSGGTVETESQTASVKIPPDALDSDTEITIKPMAAADQPAATKLASNAYEFGPDGTTFSKPVEITIQLEIASVPKNKKTTMAVLSKGDWKEVDGATVSGDKVTAKVDHFSTYAIILIADPSSVSSQNNVSLSCENYTLDSLYDCNGGDVTGTWTVSEVCADTSMIADEFMMFDEYPSCNDIEVVMTGMHFDATIEFTSGGDYTASSSGGSMGSVSIVFPADCLSEMTDGSVEPSSMCTSMAEYSSDMSCTFSGDKCSCTMTPDDDMEMDSMDGSETGTYSTDGNYVTLMPDDSDESPYGGYYCVEGNTLAIEIEEGMIFIGTKR